jgi:hypothetical protein
MRRPRWKRCRAVRTLPPDTVCLVSEAGYTVLEGRLYTLLAEHIDGRNGPEDIVARVAGKASSVDVGFGLAQLEAHGFLEEAGSASTSGALLQIHDEGDVLVVVTDDYLREELREIATRQQSLGRPWLPVKPAGEAKWAGPIFDPPRTACWVCLEQRLRETPRGRILTLPGGATG